PGADTDGRYILGRPHTVRRYGREGGAAAEQRFYYDGPDFVGLPHGKLTLGNVTRVTARVRAGADETIDVARSAYDEHGNVVVTLDPLGSPDDESSHRRSYEYDATGLRIVRTNIHLTDPDG